MAAWPSGVGSEVSGLIPDYDLVRPIASFFMLVLRLKRFEIFTLMPDGAECFFIPMGSAVLFKLV